MHLISRLQIFELLDAAVKAKSKANFWFKTLIDKLLSGNVSR